MLNLNKYVVKTDNHQPLHTSGFAYAANGDHIGASSSTSFEQRQRIDQDRQYIMNYRASRLGRQVNRQKLTPSKAKTQTEPKAQQTVYTITPDRRTRGDIPIIPMRPQTRLNVPPRHTFVEPKSNGYDPYFVK